MLTGIVLAVVAAIFIWFIGYTIHFALYGQEMKK